LIFYPDSLNVLESFWSRYAFEIRNSKILNEFRRICAPHTKIRVSLASFAPLFSYLLKAPAVGTIEIFLRGGPPHLTIVVK
jgi:hypothetical protein